MAGVRQEHGEGWGGVRRMVRRVKGQWGCSGSGRDAQGNRVKSAGQQGGMRQGRMQALSLKNSELCPQDRQRQRRRHLLRR